MAEFVVEQRQVGAQTHIVDAASKAEAVRLVRAGEGHPVGFEIVSSGGYTVFPTSREVSPRDPWYRAPKPSDSERGA